MFPCITWWQHVPCGLAGISDVTTFDRLIFYSCWKSELEISLPGKGSTRWGFSSTNWKNSQHSLHKNVEIKDVNKIIASSWIDEKDFLLFPIIISPNLPCRFLGVLWWFTYYFAKIDDRLGPTSNHCLLFFFISFNFIIKVGMFLYYLCSRPFHFPAPLWHCWWWRCSGR